MHQRDKHLLRSLPPIGNVVLHDRDAAREVVLVAQSLKNPLRRVLLLLRSTCVVGRILSMTTMNGPSFGFAGGLETLDASKGDAVVGTESGNTVVATYEGGGALEAATQSFARPITLTVGPFQHRPVAPAREVLWAFAIPTLLDGDIVLVDLGRRSPTPPGIFVLYDGMGLVAKRVEHITNSDPPRVRIISDNPLYKPYEGSGEEVNIIWPDPLVGSRNVNATAATSKKYKARLWARRSRRGKLFRCGSARWDRRGDLRDIQPQTIFCYLC